MSLLLFESIDITSPLTPGEVEKELQSMTSKPSYSFKLGTLMPLQRPFIGKIENFRFTIRLSITGRNSFLPLIKGTIAPHLNGSLIRVRMRLHLVVILVMIWFCGFLGVAGTNDLRKSIRLGQFGVTDFIPFGMILVIIVFAIVEFHRQSITAKHKLLEITNGEIL